MAAPRNTTLVNAAPTADVSAATALPESKVIRNLVKNAQGNDSFTEIVDPENQGKQGAELAEEEDFEGEDEAMMLDDAKEKAPAAYPQSSSSSLSSKLADGTRVNNAQTSEKGEPQQDARETFLHLLSWNVAAWQTTLERIGVDGDDVSEFWSQHDADIVCIQEVKITSTVITAQARKIGAFAKGFETFWAPCYEKDPNRKGMQGVATWARTGLTIRADPQVLQDPELDAMGRCLFTEHHEFGLFNVYAPAGSNGTELRMRFYNALRSAMIRERKRTNKPIILCGDLNLAAGPLDVHYMSCRIDINALLAGTTPCACGSTRPQCCHIKQDLQEWWPSVLRALNARVYKTEITRSTVTKEARERYRMVLNVPIVGGETREVKVGKLRDSESYFEYMYNYEERNPSVADIAELLKAVADINWVWRDMLLLSKHSGKSPNDPRVIHWFHNELGTQDGMIDTFRTLYPYARNRFTCWDQYTNSRYENRGARIDYFVIDKLLEQRMAQTNITLRCGCRDPAHHSGGVMGFAAAKCAATAGGRFQPAAFSGGGLQGATEAATKSQFGLTHNGIIYTPPKYSDHVGVSLCLRLDDTEASKSCILDDRSRTTKRAQPHKKQRHITNFFAVPQVKQEKSQQDSIMSIGVANGAPSADLSLSKQNKSQDSIVGKGVANDVPSVNLSLSNSKLEDHTSEPIERTLSGVDPTNTILQVPEKQEDSDISQSPLINQVSLDTDIENVTQDENSGVIDLASSPERPSRRTHLPKQENLPKQKSQATKSRPSRQKRAAASSSAPLAPTSTKPRKKNKHEVPKGQATLTSFLARNSTMSKQN